MLSTANNRLLVLQIFERPSISTILIIGFVGVSTQINFVFDEIKFSISLRFLRSVNTNFNPNFLKRMSNSLEKIAFKRYSSLKKIKEYLINLQNPIFVRMTGSGSALVSYYYSKKQCDKAQTKFI